MRDYTHVAKKLLGEDIFEKLNKAEVGSGIYKPDTRTALDPEELRIALQIVPKAIISYLVANLKPLKEGGNKELNLPFADARLHVTKVSHDVYMGEIYENGQRKTEFKYRSLPGIGIILMSTFELYDMADIDKINTEEPKDKDKELEIQKIIDERMRLHCLIKDVVDQRISQREAIQQMINEKISNTIVIHDEDHNHYEDDEEDIDEDYEEEYEEDHDEDGLDIDINDSDEDQDESEEDIMDNISKKSKLKQFLDNREKKRDEKVELDKSEKITCPDCTTDIYKGGSHFKLCLCYGDHYNKNIKIKKTEDGKFNFKFPKSFDTDNVEMLLEAIKSNK